MNEMEMDMKKLSSVFFLVTLFAVSAVSVGCSSSQKKSDETVAAAQVSAPAAPADLGAASSGRGR